MTKEAFPATIELSEGEAAIVRDLAERFEIPIEALLSAAVQVGIGRPIEILEKLNEAAECDPRRRSPLLDPHRKPALSEPLEDDLPF